MKPHNKKNIDQEWVHGRFDAGLTIIEIAAEADCSVEPIKRILKELGLRRKAARRKGKAAGPGNPAWSGGRRIRRDGYVLFWTAQGERLEHQVLMEKQLGRKLVKGEIVHHKDGNKRNNSIENLELMTQSEHAKLHAPQMHKARYGR
jgi:hypothetical protein